MTALLALAAALAGQAPAPVQPAASTERQDRFAPLAAELAQLPGSAGLGIYALEPTGPRPLFEIAGTKPAPVGSSFKLWVLAEAVRQVASGRRKWSDVVLLGPRSLPSGWMQAWPDRAPVTLQTLATQMIAISNNTAADTLMTALGRARVDAMATVLAGPAAAPVPTTRELAAIKADANLTAAWAAATPAAKRALLLAQRPRLAAAKLDPTLFDRGPVAPATVEWFASPRAMARTLDWLRRHGDRATQTILSINRGLPPATTAGFTYVGYKGGSEPGVIAMNLLLGTRDGRWFAVTGNWWRADAAVDDARFAGLMARAVKSWGSEEQ